MAKNPRSQLSPRLELTPTVAPRTGLAQRLNAHQRTGVWLLRLDPAALDEALARLAAANPALRFTPLRTGRAPDAAAPLSEADRLAQGPESLALSLMRQLAAQRLAPEVSDLALRLVGDVRDDGYLDATPDLRALERLPGFAAALAALQACDPPGVGARTLAEALALQLVAAGLSRAEAQATVAHLPLFAERNIPALARALSLTPAQVETRMTLLKGLSPVPVAASTAPAPVLLPDLVLRRLPTGELRVELARDTQPALSLDARFAEVAQAQGFGADLIAQARSLIEALAQRGRTLMALGEWLLSRHGEAMARGLPGPAPATRRMAAQALGLHPSTVGRAVADKVIDIDGRLIPLGRFFSGATGAQPDEISANFVKSRLAALIAAEPAAAPLSDDAITALLQEEGVDIARRTVAKYRQDLRIPTSAQRKRRKANRRA